MKLDDDDIMPWRPHKGKPLGDVPRSFWRWLLTKPDFTEESYPDLYRYAKFHQDEPKSYEEVVAEFLRGGKSHHQHRPPTAVDDTGEFWDGSDPFANA